MGVYSMYWYHWIALSGLVVCKIVFIARFIRLIRMGIPKDLSKQTGSITEGVVYSCTKAMMPHNKESAYLHLPTFTAGLLFHAGIFLSLAAFVWSMVVAIFGLTTPPTVAFIGCGILLITTGCGVGILFKRLFNKELRALSCADDYISNGITTLFQFVTAGWLFCSEPFPYFIVAALFFLWLPAGKTRHLLYFFAARFHLGFFYGRRGTWPE